MNVETFFQRFESLAETPNAIAQLRTLVLQLAVQGRLTDDRAPKRVVRLEEIIELVSGRHLQPASWNVSQRGIPYITGPADFGPKEPTPTRWTESPEAVAEPGDILVTVKGAGVGKTNRLRAERTAISRQLMAVRVSGADADFVHLVLQNAAAHFQSQMVGIAIPGIGRDDLLDLEVILPPLAEQKRIVAKVDELMALCDRLEAQQAEREARHTPLARAALARFAESPTPANLEYLFHPSFDIGDTDLRKAIMSAAMKGGLTRGGVEPDSWRTKTLGEVCSQITDGEHATPQRTPAGVPLVTAKNVRDGHFDLHTTDFVSQPTADKCWKRCKPRHNDVLMVCVGATTGRVCLAHEPPDMVLVRSVALLRPNPEQIEPSFLDLFLRSPAGQSQIWGNVKQSAQPCLYLGKMAAINVLLPPLAEQRRIVAKVNQLMALVDQLEAQIAAARSTGEALMDAVVHELTAAG